MEPQTLGGQSVYSENSSPKNNNKYYLGLLFLILVAVGAYFIYSNLTSKKKITGLEVAKKINIFIDTTIQSNGGMSAGVACNSKLKSCAQPVEVDDFQPHLGQAIYSYYLLGLSTGDQTYRDKADKAMDYVLDKCKTNVQMCAWNFFPLAKYYFDTKENIYLNAMLKPAGEFLALTDEDVITQNVGHKLASLYKATGDEIYKKRLLTIADKELSNWSNKKDLGPVVSTQTIWSIFLPAYDLTKDSKYLTVSESFFDGFVLAEHFSEFLYVDHIVKGVDALITLSEISEKGTVYKKQAHNALQGILDNFWDTPEAKKINGDYGILEKPEAKSNKDIVLKKTINNGWASKSFTRLAEDEFILPTND